MKKHYFLGLSARRRGAFRQLLTHGRARDRQELADFLKKKYQGHKAYATRNGRSGLTIALAAYLERGDGVVVNGFTCYAVVEAVKSAGMVPIYADIDRKTLNFTVGSIEAAIRRAKDAGIRACGIIVQNTLGIPAQITDIQACAKKHNLVIIEDLAHSVGVKYSDGREAGMVGSATVLSFGKDKAVDTIAGGAVVFRDTEKHLKEAPSKLPKFGDYLRARCYPMFAAATRGLARIHLGGALMRLLVKIHFVERSADSRLDTAERIANFEARLALRQLECRPVGVGREFYLVCERDDVLQKLKSAGYHFAGFWYEKPISPERYYKKAHFDERECPVATDVASRIINFPTYYSKAELALARKIIKEYLEDKKK